MQRKEDWGYLLQDEWNDRLWAVDHEIFGQMKAEDGSLPVWLENPYQYQGKFELGAIPQEKTIAGAYQYLMVDHLLHAIPIAVSAVPIP